METRKNIFWINAARAICIIAVYFVHCQNYYGYGLEATKYILPFYVNGFFFVSGYLFFRKQLGSALVDEPLRRYVAGGGRTLLANVLFRIVIPTLIFSMIEFLPSYVLRGKPFDSAIFLYKTFGGGTYWFTSALAVAQSLLLLLLLTRRRAMAFYVGCGSLLALLGYFLISGGVAIFPEFPAFPWQYQHGLYAILFMVAGGAYWTLEETIDKNSDKLSLLCFIALYALLLGVRPKSFHVLISMLSLDIDGVALSLLSVFILVGLCKMMRRAKILDYIGQNTIGLYFMSGALPIVFSMLAGRFGAPNLFGLIAIFVGSLATAVAAVYLMNRYIPFIFDLRKLWNRQKQTLR